MKKNTPSSSSGTRPKSKQPGPSSASGSKSKDGPKTVAPRGQQSLVKRLENAQLPIKKVDGMYVPEGYRMREIKPAKNYDVVSMARAMNDDFAPKLKELFDTETAAAIEAQQTGLYIAWRCPDFQHDCQRVNRTSRCFCDHSLAEHDKYDALSVRVKCKVPGCSCKAYAWIPNRPEDIGEFWLPKRPGFDPAAWRAKCKCKHTHNYHDANRPHRCKTKGMIQADKARYVKGCPCSGFYSDFLCAACDRHWEEHQTFFESEKSRRENGLPVGTDWIPFAEMPDLRNIALTGDETDDRRYLELRQFDPIPSNAVTGNNAVVNFGAGARGNGGGVGGRAGPSGPKGSGFRPVYD